jgi:hypothetical protein
MHLLYSHVVQFTMSGPRSRKRMSDPDPDKLVQELLSGLRQRRDTCDLEDPTFRMISALGSVAVPALEAALADERTPASGLGYSLAVVLFTELAAAHAPQRLVVVARKIHPSGRDEIARVLGWKEVPQVPEAVYQELMTVFQSEPPVHGQWLRNLAHKRQSGVL